jgi:membrane-bound metal-dependent hydrolase YbcI (DUF457 family)
MMATGHTSLAAAVITPTIATLCALGAPIDGGHAAAFTLVAVGCSVLPDCDHPEGCVAHSLGRPTRWACQEIHDAHHGHRNGTHSIPWAAIPGTLTAVATWLGGIPAAGVVVALSTLWALMGWPIAQKVCRPRRRRHALLSFRARDRALDLVVALAAGVIVPQLVAPGWWLPGAVVTGCWLHLVGDAPTETPIPWFWPFSDWRWAAGWFPTGGWWEDPEGNRHHEPTGPHDVHHRGPEPIIAAVSCVVAIAGAVATAWATLPAR